MILNEQIAEEKEIKRLERELTKEFLEKENLTKFEKETLKYLKGFIASSHKTYGAHFYMYLRANEQTLMDLIKNLDEETKELVISTIKQVEYNNTHNYADLLRNLYEKRNELMKYIKSVNSYNEKDLKLHANLYEQSVFGYKHGLIYLPEERIKSLDNKDFLDCGAFIGDSALNFEKFYNPRKIYSFEPDNESYNYIFETIKLNNLTKVVPVNLGVGAESKISSFVHMSVRSYVTDGDSNVKVNITSIDNYVFEKKLDVGLIKIDVEGYELEVLKDAVRTIEQFKPVLSICIYHNAEEFVNAIKFVKDLNMNYNIIIRHLGGLIPIIETHLIAW